MTQLIALIPAGGVGQRASEPGQQVPKQYRIICGQPMLVHTVHALLSDARVQTVHIGVAAADQWVEHALSTCPTEQVQVHRSGGSSRALTVLQTLQTLLHLGLVLDNTWVLVHDAARPGLGASNLKQLIDTCIAENQGGILAMPVPDTVKKATSATRSHIEVTIDRQDLWLAQTPQMFKIGELSAALEYALAHGSTVTDEASAMELVGQQPLLVQGHWENLKVTWPSDFILMEKYLCR